MTAEEDIASVAGQMADLTRTVAAMEAQFRATLPSAKHAAEVGTVGSVSSVR